MSSVRYLIKSIFIALVLCTSATFAYAGIIDFEYTANGDIPLDNQLIELSDKFLADGVLVSFGFDTNGNGILDQNAVYEQVSNTDKGRDTGFLYSGTPDQAASGFEQQLGDFFIRQSMPYEPFGVFTILYESDIPVTAASGEIWDIDGHSKTEQFLVKAFNGDVLLEEINSPLGKDKSLNGKPWAFGFSDLANVTKIEITFTGTKQRGIGLAFNNFSPVQDISGQNFLSSVKISEPPIYMLLLAAFLLLITDKASKSK